MGLYGDKNIRGPWLINVNVWQKPLQYCEVISLQIIKIIGKKILEESLIHVPNIYATQTRVTSVLGSDQDGRDSDHGRTSWP